MDAEALQSVCSLCGFREAEPFPKMEKEYSLVRCGNCGVVRLGPIPPENELAIHHKGDYYKVPRGRLGRLLGSLIGGLL